MQQLELVSLLEKRKLIRNTAIRYVGKYIGDLSPMNLDSSSTKKIACA